MKKYGSRFVLCMILTLALVFSLAACSLGTKSPTQVTEDFLKAVQQDDEGTIKDTYAGGKLDLDDLEESESDSSDEAELSDETEKLFIQKLRDFEYTVSDEKIDGDKATVKVKLKTYDFGTAFSDFVSDYMEQAMTLALSGASDEKIQKLADTLCQKQLKKLDKKKYSKTVTVGLSKKDGKWQVNKITDDSAFLNALSGGLVETAKSYSDAFSDTDD